MELRPQYSVGNPVYPGRDHVRRRTKLLKRAAVAAAILALPVITTGCSTLPIAGGIRQPPDFRPEVINANGEIEKATPSE